MTHRDRAFITVIVIMFVFLVALEVQVQQLQRQNDRTEAVVNDTKALVDGAINNPNNAATQAATAHALSQIAAIEYRLCNGPCPPAPTPVPPSGPMGSGG